MAEHKNIHKLLEQYVFSVAASFIDQVDTETQNSLIKLYRRLGNEPTPDVDTLSLVDVLNEPLEKKPNNTDEHHLNVERLIAIHQVGIDSTRNTIAMMDQLVYLAKRQIKGKARKARLIKKYTDLKTGYLIYLHKLSALQQHELTKLE